MRAPPGQKARAELATVSSFSILRRSRFSKNRLRGQNVDANGEILAANDRLRMSTISNRLWHTDASFEDPAGRYSMLSARVVPQSGQRELNWTHSTHAFAASQFAGWNPVFAVCTPDRVIFRDADLIVLTSNPQIVNEGAGELEWASHCTARTRWNRRRSLNCHDLIFVRRPHFLPIEGHPIAHVSAAASFQPTQGST